jgi:hypothetical protein
VRPHNNDDNRHNEEMFNLLSQLQLPKMSMNEAPSLRILVVADIDLKSAAALAKHALQNQQLGGGNIVSLRVDHLPEMKMFNDNYKEEIVGSRESLTNHHDKRRRHWKESCRALYRSSRVSCVESSMCCIQPIPCPRNVHPKNIQESTFV